MVQLHASKRRPLSQKQFRHAPRRRHRSSGAQRRRFRALARFLRQGARLPRLQALADAAGWSNRKTLFWIAKADARGRKHKHRKGDIGFHHYAFELGSRKDVDDLGAFLDKHGMTVVDPPGEYNGDENYYAVFFTDPDGMKLEGMVYKPAARRKRAPKKAKR